MSFLVALDSSDYAYKIVDYLASNVQKDVHITLFTVLDNVDELVDKLKYHPEFSGDVQEIRKAYIRHASNLRELMEKCKQILIKAGIPEENIKISAQTKKIGIARDIIQEAERGEYDTIVVGRRGASGISSFLFGSVSNKVVQHLKDLTIWIIESDLSTK